MASGTQGYEAAQGDIIESLVDRFKKRKKNDKKGDTSPPPNQPASISVSTPTQKMLVQGKTVQQLMPGSSALATTTGGDITQYSSENGEVLSVLVRETQTTNKLLQAQNQLLLRGSKGGAITKFDKQEAALEETEDLSDTQGYEKAKQKNPFKALWDMIWGGIKGFLAPILEAVKALAPAIAIAAAGIIGAIKAQAIAQALGGLTQSLRGLRGGGIKPVTVRDVTGMPRGALTGTNVKGALPPGKVTPSSSLVRTNPTAIPGQKALPPGQGTAFKPQVQAKTKVLETVDLDNIPDNMRGKTGMIDQVSIDKGNFKGKNSVFQALTQQANSGVPGEAKNAREMLRQGGATVTPQVRPKTPAIPKGVTNNADAVADAAKLANKGGAAKYLIPGASAITAGLSVISGDYAGAIVDAADATGDAIAVSGATGAMATVGAALANTAFVLGAGISSSYVGQATREVGDWVRGDGNNMALNLASSIIEGLSATLETVGAPFRAIFEFINSGFNIEKSNEVMAGIDSNIRESARQGLNAIDFLNIIPDEKGAFGTLGLYGDAATRADAKMRGEGEVKNARGGSYFLDNPSNFGPFQGGEAGGEVVTFTPFGGRRLVNEMGAHMTDALQAPFQFAIGGIAAAVDKVIGMLGPIGQMLKSAIGPTLEKLVKASGLTNLNLKNVTGGLGPMGGLFGGGLNDMFSGLLPGLNLTRNTLNRGPGGAPRPGSTAGSDVLNIGSGGGQLKGLTREDYEYMARTIAGEAGPGDDQYLVAGAILNRVASGKFPNSVKSVVTAGQGTAHPQFEGYRANANTDEIVARLMSPEGQARLVASLNRLQGRTDFKGQTQLQNRVASMDPMFDKKGNFAHYYYETGPNSVRPSNYVDPNYQQFIKQQNNTPVTAPPTLGSNFPNINAPTLSTTDQILMETMPELFRAMQSLKSLSNGGGNTTTTDGTGGILQPASDPHASLFAPLHLSRLGAN